MLWSTLINRASKHFIEVFIDVLGPSSQPLILSQRVPPLGRNHRVLVAIVTAVVIVVAVVVGCDACRRVLGVVRRLADAVENLGIVSAELVL